MGRGQGTRSGKKDQDSDASKKTVRGRTGSESNESKGTRQPGPRAKQPASAGKQAGSGKDDPGNRPKSNRQGTAERARKGRFLDGD